MSLSHVGHCVGQPVFHHSALYLVFIRTLIFPHLVILPKKIILQDSLLNQPDDTGVSCCKHNPF